jgi:hypothetical protein
MYKMYIKRSIDSAIREAVKVFPVVAVTGPRQSGKTTLVKKLFPEKPYFNLEFPDISEAIESDPRAFFNKLSNGAVIDEVQRFPELLRYIQGIVDEQQQPGLFIITGSNQFLLLEKITESLAGRVALFKLMPFSLSEIKELSTNISTDELILKGMYPAIHAKQFPAYQTYQNYYETYLERDLRKLLNVKDLSTFKKFVRLCAGRTGQILNASSLSNETGISSHTVKSWLSILEASFILFLLNPWHDNISKRLIKSPKIYFYDTGLASFLLGIENTNQLSRDPLRGSLFESMIISEFFKKRFNKGLDARYFFLRDNHGNEVDLLIPEGNEKKGVEIKSSQTFHKEFFKGLKYLKSIYPESNTKNMLIYDGKDMDNISDIEITNFRNCF